MKTSAILTPASPVTGTSSAAKQSASSSDGMFNQMLSREIAGRNQAAEPARTPAKQSAPASQAQQGPRSTANAEKSPSTDEGKVTTSEDGVAAPVTEGVAAKVGTSDGASGGDAATEDDEAALAALPDELLALVAGINQAVAQAAASAAAAQSQNNTEQGTAAPALILAQPADLAASAAAAAVAAVAADVPDAPATADTAALAAADQPVAGQSLPAAVTAAANDRPVRQTTDSGARGKPAAFDAALAQAGDASASSANAAHAPAHAKEAAPATTTDAATAQAKQAETVPAESFRQAPDLRAADAAQDGQLAAAPVNMAATAPAPLQHAHAAAASAVAADSLSPRVGGKDWDQALGQKVVWMVAGAQQSASLTLNPPDLGPLQVVLNVSNNNATATFTAAQPEVRQALEAAMPKLREMLGDAGIQLGQANVNAGTPNHQHSAFGDRQQQQSSRRGAGYDGDSADAAAAPVVTRSQPIRGGQGMVDTFA